ncbi:MAG: biopolymer transporter ExbD [Sphingomonadaceae bacterium]|nr:biopolymer transporter ExbD [Sphingomonadaceae bacterium]
MRIGRKAAAEPMKEINTTPLIDVMLVLLIMFILVVPAITHKVPIDLPPPTPTVGPETLTERLDIVASGALYWNGEALPVRALPERLETMVADPARPILLVRTDGGARYGRVDHLLATIARSGVTRMAFSGHGDFADAF